MPSARHHQDLKAWQLAIDLAVASHHLVLSLPPEDRIAFGTQIRRSAVSVAANIAEGAGRVHRREFVQFPSFARGSLQELQTHLEVLRRIGCANEKELATCDELLDHVGRMLTLLLRALGRRSR